MNHSQNSFLDPKTIVAIILVALGWFSWDSYMRKKYPQTYARKSTSPVNSSSKKGGVSESKVDGIHNQMGAKPDNQLVKEEDPEVLHQYENDKFSFVVTSKGMGLRNVVLKDYTKRDGSSISLGNESEFALFETNLIGRVEALNFSIEQTEENQLVGLAQHGSTQIRKIFSIDPETYTFHVDVQVSDITIDFLGLTTYLSEYIEEAPERSFLMPTFGGQEVFTLNSEGQDRAFIRDIEDTPYNINSISIAALGNQYFSQAIIDKSSVISGITFFKVSDSIVGRLSHSILNRSSEFSINYIGFVGPKSADILERLSPDLPSLIDLGWFSWIGKVLMKALGIFYSMSGNWGVAIILMTLLVRFMLLPLNLFSYKSMKKMQIIQPEIKKVREQYKKDPQKMNREVMALMRENKANPISGCLPMLLQFPIFIALYRVLGQSIELYQAPFVLWIQDLSLKDPFYILPILMGVAMFVQMKIQPNTMEPAQRRIMMLMPLLFSFFMLSLPSGLTLYILVSTVFGIVQHFYFMRNTERTVVLQETKEEL